MSFSKFIDRIKAAGEDLLSIDVVTLTGNVNVTIKGDKIDFDALVKSLQTQVAKTDGTIKIVAFTRIDVDKDAVQFVKSGLSSEEAPMVSAHNEMVKTAQDARMAVVNFLKGLVPI